MSEAALSEIRTHRGMIVTLARKLGVTQGAVSKWRRIPAERVLDVERITGIDRHVLRPDLYPEPRRAPSQDAA